MPAIYIFVYYEAGLYADFGINIYYLVVAVYGYIGWKYGFGKKKEAVELPISRVPLKVDMPLVIVFAVLWWLIYYVLANFTNSNVPVWDSFTNALSIVAMWMLARKYVEQWLLWIVVDAVSCGLYVYKDLYFTSGLYGLYAIIAIFGYRSWLKRMKQEQT